MWIQLSASFQFTCNGSVTKYKICAENPPLDEFEMKLFLFVINYNTTLAKPYVNNSPTIHQDNVNTFREVESNTYVMRNFQPGSTLGALVRILEGYEAYSETSEKCIERLLVTTNESESCIAGHGPYILQLVTEDCIMNTEDNEGKLCMQSEEMSSNESTMNLTSSPSTTQDTTSFSTTSHLGLNTNPSTWAIAIIATLLLLLLGETIICILLWIVCLKYQKLYAKAVKCKIFTGHSTGAVSEMREQPPSDAYHSLENPSHSDYEEVNNNSSKAKVSTKPKVVPLQSPYSHCGENEIEHSEETEFVNNKVYMVQYCGQTHMQFMLYVHYTHACYHIITDA
jgi:hypothetical protein